MYTEKLLLHNFLKRSYDMPGQVSHLCFYSQPSKAWNLPAGNAPNRMLSLHFPNLHSPALLLMKNKTQKVLAENIKVVSYFYKVLWLCGFKVVRMLEPKNRKTVNYLTVFTGIINVSVEPLPSSDSTLICPS